MKKIILAHIALIFANLIYAINFTLAKDVMPDTISPVGFILLRVTGAMVLFHLIHFILVREKVKRSDYLILILCGLFGVAINMSFFFLGLNYTTPIHAAVTMTSAPIIIFVLAVIFHGEKKSPHRIVGVMLGAIGAIILAVYGRKFEIGNPHLALGNLFVLINAFSYGAPPHGGIAPGIDRIVMLLADEPNIREVILFPMTGKAEDLMMGAPSQVSEKQLNELGLSLKTKK